MLTKTMARVTQDDPVQGDLCINGNGFTVQVDASSLAVGAALEANGAILGDTCWLWMENDARHINLAELDATLRELIWHFSGKPGCFTLSH